MTRALVLIPSIHDPYTDACVSSMGALSEDAELVVVDNTAFNRGVAGSWNIGARRVLDEGLDWLVCVSAAMRFNSPNLGGFLSFLEEHPFYAMVEGGWGSLPEGDTRWDLIHDAIQWHLMAISRRVFQHVGLFDENYYPGWGEELDWTIRVDILGRPQPRVIPYWQKAEVDGYVEMVQHAYYLGGVRVDHAALSEYHERKWGAPLGTARETFTHPFNDPALPLSFWPTPPDPRCSEPYLQLIRESGTYAHEKT